MGKRKFEELKYRLCDELTDLAERDRWSAKDVELIDRLTHSIKSLMTYLNMEDEDERDYSSRSYARGRYNSRYYRDDRSYDDGKYYDDGYRGRSYDDGMELMTHELEELMAKTTDADVKEAIKKTMNQLKKNK